MEGRREKDKQMLERLEDVSNDELDVGIVEVDVGESVGEHDGKVLLKHDLSDVKRPVVGPLGLDARSGGEESVAELREGVKSSVSKVDVVRRRGGVLDGL
jgi:hypothetical protein